MYSSLFIFILLFMTMIKSVYLVQYRPFKTNLLQGLELFNEVTSIILLCITLCFTEYFVTKEQLEGYSEDEYDAG